MKNLALIFRTVAAWGITLLIVFPLIWLVLTAFKTEQQAISVPPLMFFTPTSCAMRTVAVLRDSASAVSTVTGPRYLWV